MMRTMGNVKTMEPPGNALKHGGKNTSFGDRALNWIYDKRLYFLVFFIAAGVIFAAYAVFGIYPFGEESVLVLDLNGQYVYYYELLRDAFWGRRSLIYSWSRNLSGELFGIYAYYLASPFMIIICLLPATMMCYSVLIMQMAKVGTAAVTFLFLLKKLGVKKPSSQVIFPLLYSLMSYVTVQLMDPMWLDALIYLPLIMWGVHRLVDEGKILPYAIPLGLMFIAHFYIGYMVGFFTLLYFIYVCLSKENRVLPKNFITVCLKFFVGTVIAIMCAAVVLIPVYNSLKLGKLEFTDPDFTMRTQFTFVEFISKLFPLSYDTVYPKGLPMIYCGVLTLLLVPMYFLNSKICLKEKIAKGTLLLILIICMWIAPIDMAWHGFQVPNWLPFRYSFTFSALLVIMAVKAYENLDGISGRAMGGTFFGLMLMIVYYEGIGLEHLKPFRKVMKLGEEKVIVQGIIVAIAAALVCYILLCLIKFKNSKVAAVFLTGAVCAELFGNTLDTFIKNDIGINPEKEGYTGLSYSEHKGYINYMKDLRSVVNQVKEQDDSFYRMEATFHRTVNDPIGVGYAGISHSSSTMNAPALTLLKDLGYTYGGHFTKYDGATPLTDSLFNIKYIMDRNDDEHRSQKFLPDFYDLKISSSETDGTEINVYENPYALSVGMAADNSITDLLLDKYNPFENQNDIINCILGNEENEEFFKRIYPESEDTENLVTSGVSDGHTKFAFENQNLGECHIDYNITNEKEGNIYMFLPTMYERKVNVWVAHSSSGYVDENSDSFEYVGSFFEGDDYSILDLGNFPAGESVRVRVSILVDDHEAYWMDELFYTFDEEAYASAVERIRPGLWNITEHTDTYLEGTVSAKEGQVLFTTIPYEEGWTIEVDGKRVEAWKSLDSLITIPLSAGEHTVTMKFFPDYFKQGIIVSICGVLALVLVFMFEYKNGRIITKIITREVSKVKTPAKKQPAKPASKGGRPAPKDTAKEIPKAKPEAPEKPVESKAPVAENATEKPAENIPAKPVESVPTKPVENVPTKPTENKAPVAENAPAKPAENVPAKPAENVSAKAAENKAPAKNIPNRPQNQGNRKKKKKRGRK